MFKIASFILFVLSSVAAYYIALEVYNISNTNPDYHVKLFDVSITIAYTALWLVLVLSLRCWTGYLAFYYVESTDNFKWTRCRNALANIVVYVVLTYRIYTTIKAEEYFPPLINIPVLGGGSGDITKVWVPNTPSDELKTVYLLQLGYHIAETILHISAPRKSDYYEMILHHIATISLTAYSYVFNYLRIGVLIMFVHDISDIFVYICKSTSELKYVPIGTFIVMVSTWVYYRIYVLVQLIQNIYQETPNQPVYLTYMMYVLCVLQCLHVWWLYLMGRIAYNLVVHDKIEDIQETPIYEDEVYDPYQEDPYQEDSCLENVYRDKKMKRRIKRKKTRKLD